MKKEPLLDALFSAVADTEGMSERELLDELKGAGINYKKQEATLDAFLDECIDGQKQRRLDVAREKRLARAPHDFLDRIRQLALPLVELRARILEISGTAAPAYRELDQQADERALLEQHLADLTALKESSEKK